MRLRCELALRPPIPSKLVDPASSVLLRLREGSVYAPVGASVITESICASDFGAHLGYYVVHLLL